MIRALTHREAEFDDEQTHWLIAYERFTHDLGQHGFSMAEATSPLADPNNYDSTLRFVSGPPVMDYAEKARLDGRDQYLAQAGEKANLNGLIFPVRRIDG